MYSERSKADFRLNPAAALAAAESRVYQTMGEFDKAQAALASADVGRTVGRQPGHRIAAGGGSVAIQARLQGQGFQSAWQGEVIKNNHENAAIASQIEAIFAREHLEQEGQTLMACARQEVIDINNGVVLAKQGHFEQGAKLLRKALKQLPGSEAITINLCGLLIGQLNEESTRTRWPPRPVPCWIGFMN